ncbi:phospholipase A [Fluviispira sanaruensis]|uniref:Phosphatidylcholine 1-acylhydrolase n=1 Tax=Fluviispira sanaruensis TaxID=2493639 RepID=A0A4P2VXA4_FLUSA|nr:phospholipase A [Fluviispira sanaruensis]BBH53622.1 hypothetical protein JCM31447_20690 [Fluviispira sanaruensis]
MFELYQDNYILPYYYTASPYYSLYNEMSVENEPVESKEFKAQLSVYAPIYEWEHISLNAAFTLKSFWQLYEIRPWFRSSDYNPEAFLLYKINEHNKASLGYSHESNGLGTDYEMSWNRVYGKFNYEQKDFSFEFMAWFLPVDNETTFTHHSEKIEDYLGYEKVTGSYKIGNFETKISIQNIENIDRIQITASQSYNFYRDYALYFQYFYGYGQSLIEFNHFTQAFGIGIQFLNNEKKKECNFSK